jgi:tRNA(fMet)-specific endonuclease VapC
MFLLDTDTLIYSLKGNPSVVENLRIHDKDPKAISVITYGELIYGAQKSERVSSNLAKVYRLRELFPIIDVTCAIMETFGALKAEMGRKGTVADDFDLIIAATAVVMGYCVVTNNERHFEKVPGLRCTNWSAA